MMSLAIELLTKRLPTISFADDVPMSCATPLSLDPPHIDA